MTIQQPRRWTRCPVVRGSGTGPATYYVRPYDNDARMFTRAQRNTHNDELPMYIGNVDATSCGFLLLCPKPPNLVDLSQALKSGTECDWSRNQSWHRRSDLIIKPGRNNRWLVRI